MSKRKGRFVSPGIEAQESRSHAPGLNSPGFFHNPESFKNLKKAVFPVAGLVRPGLALRTDASILLYAGVRHSTILSPINSTAPALS